MSPSVVIWMVYPDSTEQKSYGWTTGSNTRIEGCPQKLFHRVTVDGELSESRSYAPHVLECYAGETTPHYKRDRQSTHHRQTSIATVFGTSEEIFRVPPDTRWRMCSLRLWDDIVEFYLKNKTFVKITYLFIIKKNAGWCCIIEFQLLYTLL